MHVERRATDVMTSDGRKTVNDGRAVRAARERAKQHRRIIDATRPGQLSDVDSIRLLTLLETLQRAAPMRPLIISPTLFRYSRRNFRRHNPKRTQTVRKNLQRLLRYRTSEVIFQNSRGAHLQSSRRCCSKYRHLS